MKTRVITLLVLCILLLSACSKDFLPPAPLPLTGPDYQSDSAGQLAIALDAQGGEHIAHIECRVSDGLLCRAVYDFRRNGVMVDRTIFPPATGYIFRNPSIAVTDSGLAFVSWQNCPTGPSSTRLCSTWFWRSDDSTMYILEVGTHSLGHPLMVSRGEVVYAVHEVTNGDTGSALRYCRVSDDPYSCYYASEHDNASMSYTDVAAAVSSSGSLHAAWLMKDSSGVTIGEAFNDNYGALNADMGSGHVIGTGLLYSPAIAIESDDGFVYITVPYNNEAASDGMQIYYCPANNCPAGGANRTVVMDPARLWGINNPPSMAAGSNWALVAFAATTNDVALSEIYTFAYIANSDAPTPARPYPTAGVDDCDPKAVVVDGWQTVGWHACGFPPARGDIYVHSTITGTRIIHPTSGTPGRGDIAMAANGEYVAGVWNEVQGDGRVATWLAFNSYLTRLPLIIR